MSGAVLEGVRVLDFGRYIAGPWCAALLGDLGADVIRVERVSGGDDRFQYPVTDKGDGACFLQMNRNKRGFTLNPMKPEGREILRRLVATANVVVVNLPAATREEMGLGYAHLRSIRPDIILTAISAFGEEGPYANRLGFDGIGQAMCGANYLSGFGD
ncbi:MAG TPA: CoA transferase, partial [Stellaceae bacterium]|nr:CoA transferase [Stellaceae bacterium]